MGLLNNWLNKKKKEQLENAGEQKKKTAPKAAAESKNAPEKTEKKEVKKAVKEKTDAIETAEVKAKGKLPAGSIAYRVLVKPLVTEKSAIAESENKYSFVVARWANKYQVKQAIKDMYGVVPEDVNMVNVNGRRIRFGRMEGRRSDYKKAIITLPQGKTITLHTGV